MRNAMILFCYLMDKGIKPQKYKSTKITSQRTDHFSAFSLKYKQVKLFSFLHEGSGC